MITEDIQAAGKGVDSSSRRRSGIATSAHPQTMLTITRGDQDPRTLPHELPALPVHEQLDVALRRDPELARCACLGAGPGRLPAAARRTAAAQIPAGDGSGPRPTQPLGRLGGRETGLPAPVEPAPRMTVEQIQLHLGVRADPLVPTEGAPFADDDRHAEALDRKSVVSG